MSIDYVARLKGSNNPNHKGVNKVCAVCGNTYLNYNKESQYCSHKCRDRARWGSVSDITERHKKRALKRKESNKIKDVIGESCRIHTVFCGDCNKLFMHQRKIKYCKHCGDKRKTDNLKRLSESQNKKILKNCILCGSPFNTPPSMSNRKFCSSKCKAQGIYNANWKGGITPINSVLRKTENQINWRISVFERDNYTCCFCGQKGGNLHADHIKPFALFPELRLDINNGRTLCKDCHKKTDSYLRNRKREYYEKQ